MKPSERLVAHWPLFGLIVRTPRLELRYPTDELLAELAELTAEGIHDADASPFSGSWSLERSPALEQNALRFWWGRRAALCATELALPMAVVVDDSVVGIQDLHGTNFPSVRSLSSGSWIVRRAQGQGIGTEMRRAILELAFIGLGAREVHSSAFASNARSIVVSRRLGYEDNGEMVALRGGSVPERSLSFRLSAERYLARRAKNITIFGLEPCLGVLGLEPNSP